MRLKSFVAENLKLAMHEVRSTLGDEAIIVNTKELRDGMVQIMAALDDTSNDATIAKTGHQEPTHLSPEDLLKVALDYHGVPLRISDRLIQLARQSPADRDTHGLAYALERMFRFGYFPVKPKRPIILVGQTAAGKTVTAAKLATRSVINGHHVTVMTTDTLRAGAVAQLSAFTRLLKQPLHAIDTPQALGDALAHRHDEDIVIIDTPGVNPFAREDIKALSKILSVHQMEPVVILPAGGDAMEAAEIISIFTCFQPQDIIITQLDVARRLGSLLAAAYAGNLCFSLISLTPFITNGLVPINASGLARLIMRDPTQSEISAELQKAIP